MNLAKSSADDLVKMNEDGLKPSMTGWGENLRKLSQAFNTMVLQVATATGRGANFTKMERDMVVKSIGVNPDSYFDWTTSGDVKSKIS